MVIFFILHTFAIIYFRKTLYFYILSRFYTSAKLCIFIWFCDCKDTNYLISKGFFIFSFNKAMSSTS
jgi:hypothetical protein